MSCIPDSTMDLTNPKVVAEAYKKVKMMAVSESGTIYSDSDEDRDKINALATGTGAKAYKELAELELANEAKKAPKNRSYPVYEYNGQNGKIYIVAIRGNGLWDKIWGYIALEADLNTIAGVYFDHKAETPGLGAEIKDKQAFKDQFIGKKVFNGEKVAITVLKRMKAGIHNVEGISGATITSDGVTDMFSSGMDYYKAYFATLK